MFSPGQALSQDGRGFTRTLQPDADRSRISLSRAIRDEERPGNGGGYDVAVLLFWLAMQMYLADCVFPEIEGQLAAYKSFCELWDSGEMAKLDNFDGFEMLFRVHAPGAGRVTILFKAESDAQIFEHFAPWRAQFGIEMDFTPVIGCQDVVDYHKKLFAKMS